MLFPWRLFYGILLGVMKTRKEFAMRKSFLLLVALAGCGFGAQDITISKDSLKIHNNPVSSFTDNVVFQSNTSTVISLDSAFITIDNMDTAGSAGYVRDDRLQVRWREHLEMPDVFNWDLKKIGSNQFRMRRRDTSSSDMPPLYFSTQLHLRRIVLMEIGGCLNCSGLPKWHSPFFSGTLVLYFSNGQTKSLRLYSDDLREPVNDGEPCIDLACDSQNVRKILDRNGMELVPVSRVSTIANGRIIKLEFVYNPLASISHPSYIKVLSPEIGNLTELKILTAIGNAFDSIPQRIGRCVNLESIFANGNGITTVPDSIVKCTRLRDISLENNRLTRLPDSIGKLKHLKSLCLVKNRLTSLPTSMADLDSVHCFFISGNRICTLPQAVIGWMNNVQTNRNCERYEPTWPDSQDCGASPAKQTQDRQRMPAFAAGRIVHEGNFITMTLGSTNDAARRLEIFDCSGRMMAMMSLPLGRKAAQTIRLNATRYPAGMYYLRVMAGRSSEIGGSFVIEQ
jgi:hypothetical protein